MQGRSRLPGVAVRLRRELGDLFLFSWEDARDWRSRRRYVRRRVDSEL